MTRDLKNKPLVVRFKQNKFCLAILRWLIIKPSIIKTIYFNFKYFSFNQAIKFPVLVSRNVLLISCKGAIEIDSEICSGMIELGFGNVPAFDKCRNRTIWNNNGRIIFKGKSLFKHGSKICVGGKLIIGNNFNIAPESKIICNKEIEIGNNVSISWQTQLIDTDFHYIYKDGKQINADRKIKIGNNVWIGNNVLIQKGTVLPDNTVVAAGSITTKIFTKKNTIIAGIPAKPIIENISWLR